MRVEECLTSLDDCDSYNLDRGSFCRRPSAEKLSKFIKLKMLELRFNVTKDEKLPLLEELHLKYFKNCIEVFEYLLEQQPKLKNLSVCSQGAGHWDDEEAFNALEIFNYIDAFDAFFDKFENLESIELIRNDVYGEGIKLIVPSEKKERPYIVSYDNYGHGTTIKRHAFLENIQTLEELLLPRHKDKDFLVNTLKNNPNIETLSCKLELLDNNYLAKEYEYTNILDINYNKVYEEFKEYLDVDILKIVRFFSIKRPLPFKPKIEILLALLTSAIPAMRKEALSCFDTYYSQKLASLNGLTIWLSGTLPIYKNSQVKEMLSEKNTKLTTKQTEKTELLVVGLKPKIDNLPVDIPIISAIKFEEMLSQSEERILVTSDNEMIFEKLKKLLESNDESNVEVACTLMEEGGIPTDLRSYVLALFTISHKKKRTRLKKIIERHAGTLGEKFLAIMGRKSSIDSKMLKQFEVLEDFDIEILMYVRNEEYYFTDKNTPLAKEMILKHFNEEQVWLYSEPSEHFLEARKIKELLLSGTNHILWKMTHIERIFLAKWNDNGLSKLDEVLISKEAENLKNLQRLTIHSQDISVDASLPITHLEIGSCKKLKMGNETLFNTLEIVEFDSCSLALIKSVDAFLTKRKMPKLKKIIFDNGYGAERKFPSKILSFLKEEFQGIDIDLRRFGE